MWEELETDIKIYAQNVPLFGEGNKNAKILILFDHPTKEMNDVRQIRVGKEYDILKTIFEYVGIDIKDCYYTLLVKYYIPNLIEDSVRKESMKYLLKEIYLVDPDYIICIGEEIFNYIYKYYTKKREENKLLVDISQSIGNIYELKGMKIVPMYDMYKIKNLKKVEKQKIVDVLKGITK